MKLLVKVTSTGLKPLYDEDLEEKKKLKMGETYEVTVKRPRNVEFHRKYFALLNTAWAYQTEAVQKGCFSNSFDCFRHTILLNTGFCERIYSYSRQEYIDIPKSVSFGKMSESEFQDVYSRTLDFIIQNLLPNISEQEFKDNIEEFMK